MHKSILVLVAISNNVKYSTLFNYSKKFTNILVLYYLFLLTITITLANPNLQNRSALSSSGGGILNSSMEGHYFTDTASIAAPLYG